MIAEIIAIGTELTSGQKLDTNSQWLSLQLADLGIPVHFHTTVGDDLDTNIDVLKTAAERADLVLLTGGLGPTLDDLTRQALAGTAGVDLVLDEPSLAFIENFFAGRGREMPQRNRIQAMFPAGSEPLPNPVGTAPGIWMEIPGGVSEETCRVAALPGVPSEMHRMFTEQVRPRLPGGARIIRRARINCFGVGESRAEGLLGDLTARGRDPEIGITAHEATITMRIIAHGSTEQECQEKIASVDRAVHERLGHYVFGTEDEELEHVLIRALRERSETLSTAESGTGGRIAHCLTSVDNFEDAYLGGLVVPTDRGRESMLGPAPEDVVEEVSEPMARWMAHACRERFGTDYALAVTQYPFMEDGQSMRDAPSAFLALATQSETIVRPISLAGNPAILRSRVAKSAMDLLRLHLRKQTPAF
ncbi:MAG: CinA family nicotinamide mononucleotide deamidase-related protein [Maioricimonas sp. JB049]